MARRVSAREAGSSEDVRQRKPEARAPGKVTKVERAYGARGRAQGHGEHADRIVQQHPRRAPGDVPDEFGGMLGRGAIQRKPLRDSLREALAPARSAASTPVVQRSLESDMRAMLGDATRPDGLVGALTDAIHRAPLAERQAAFKDTELRKLINTRLGSQANVVIYALMAGSQQWKPPPTNMSGAVLMGSMSLEDLPMDATMNCFESILYATHLAGTIDVEWLQEFYEVWFQGGSAAQKLGFTTSLPQYTSSNHSGTPGRVVPVAGQILFYCFKKEPPGHMALSLGGNEAISLWNQPNNIDVVQRIHVEDLVTPDITVYVGNPPW